MTLGLKSKILCLETKTNIFLKICVHNYRRESILYHNDTFLERNYHWYKKVIDMFDL